MAGIALIKDSVRMYLGADKTADADRPLTLSDKVANATSISEFGADSEEIDVTTLESQGKESEGGYDDFGSITVEQNITSDEYTKMNAWRAAKTTLKFGVVAKNKDGEAVFGAGGKCWVKTCKFGGATVGGLLKVTSELKITGHLEAFTEPTA